MVESNLPSEPGPAAPRRSQALSRILYVAFSLVVTVAIFSYLFRTTSWAQVSGLLTNLPWWAIASFLVLSFTQSLFRLWRYKVLLRLAGMNPGGVALFLIVLVRNFFSDLLPGRIGTLIYVYLVNTRLKVPFAGAASSFSLSFIFDFLALAPLMVLAVWAAGAVGTMSRAGLVTGAVVLFAVMAIAVAFLPWCFRFGGWVIERLPLLSKRLRHKWGAGLRSVEGEILRAQKGGIYLRLLLLSVMVRVGKYGSYYALLYGMLRPLGYTADRLPVSRVFLGFLAPEMAASLPISGIAGFGAYEGAWKFVFQILGFPPSIAASTGIAHHLFSQVYGYSLGALALLVLLLPFFRAARPLTADTPVRDRAPIFYLKFAALSAALLAAAAAFLCLPAKPAAAAPAPAAAPAADHGALTALAQEFGGRIVFDSNRSGSFGIWTLAPDGSDARPLFDGPLHELYPDPSPDGGQVVFARTASLEKGAASEIWIGGADGRGERRLAEDGTFPTFFSDGRSVCFERGRGKAMVVEIATGAVREIFPAGHADFSDDLLVKPRISPDGRRVAFISKRGFLARGYSSWTVEFPAGALEYVGNGCEPGWFPDGRLAWVREGEARERTGIFVYDPARGTREALQDDDAPFGHEYFPTVTRDGQWLLWGACPPGQHEHVSSNYQLFARRLPDGKPVRLTFDEFDNRWPKRLPKPMQAGAPAEPRP